MDWKRMLLPLDFNPTSLNAVSYTASIAGKHQDVLVCLLHIFPDPPPDFYGSGGVLQTYQREQRKKAKPLFREARQILLAGGLEDHNILDECQMATQRTISQAILEVQAVGEFGTVIVGKRGVSREEEFLFGSISTALIHHSKNTAVWVVS